MDVSLIIIGICIVLAIALLVIYVRFGRSEEPFRFDIGERAPQASGGKDDSNDKGIFKRLVSLSLGVAGVFATLLARLASMQLLSEEDYHKLAENNRTSTIYTQAPRGRILDRNGIEIVGNRPSLTVVAIPDVVDKDIEIQLLANLLGMPSQALRRKLQDTSLGHQSLRVLSVDVSRRIVAYLGEHPGMFPGVSVQERTQRSYPHHELAAHVVGYTGTVTQEQLDASKKAIDEGEVGAIEYRSGDVVGQAGVELQYESSLQGVRGEQLVHVDAHGKILDFAGVVDPEAGSDVVLTLDTTIQKVAEESLRKTIEQVRKEGYVATGGSVIAIDCTNGEILALANYPTYAPSRFVGGIAASDWDALTDPKAQWPLMNRAISGQYPSGSVIKPLSSFAGLNFGVAQTDSSWYCSGWWSWSGKRSDSVIMKCWYEAGHGAMNIPDGITFSCDVVFYEIGKGFFNSENKEGLQETFRQYGLGALTGVDLPSEAAGRIPDAQWKWNYFKDASDEARAWKGGDNCNIAIGQGDMLVTLIQMACAYCSIANKGAIWRPHVLKGIRSRLGTGLVSEYKPEVTITVEEEDYFRTLIDRGMQGVVYRESPSQTAHWKSLNVEIHGKTGTAEQPGGDPIGWFIGFGPAEAPRYVVGSHVDRVLQGASSAMYVVRDVFGAIYGQPDPLSPMTK